jgi:hypothetical protein
MAHWRLSQGGKNSNTPKEQLISRKNAPLYLDRFR